MDSTATMNYMRYDQRQSRGNKHAKNYRNGKPVAQKHGDGSWIHNFNNSTRIAAEMEGKCLKYGKNKHQAGQKCSAHGQKCKTCGKMVHFSKVCLFSRRQLGISSMVGNVQVQEKKDETYLDKIEQTQPYPKVNMIKLINTLRKQADGVETCLPDNLKLNVSLIHRRPSIIKLLSGWIQVKSTVWMRKLSMHLFLKWKVVPS